MDRVVHIVVDDAALCRRLERALHAAGFTSAVHATPRALLDMAARGLAGCVLLDVRRPDTDGMAVPARLNELGLRLSVIVMTGRGDIRSALEALKAGAVDFIEAPFDAAAVLAAVEAALAGTGRGRREPGAIANAAG
jgi:two-component system, LuxR family, response regulator FixJ